MLEYLHVKNLALIREAEIEFGPGLSIISGETGAGKSVLLSAVGLALGERADASMIRSGAEFCSVELIFRIPDAETESELRDLGTEPEDGRLIIVRRIYPGKSSAKVNGESVTLAELRKLAPVLIDIHGQHEHQTLLNEENHLAVLDAYAKIRRHPAYLKMGEAYRNYRSKADEVRSLGGNDEERKREIDFLKYEIEEIREADIREGEEESLTKEHHMLAHGIELQQALQRIGEALQGSANDAVSQAVRASADAIRYDASMQEIRDELMNLESLMQDLEAEVEARLSSLDFSEERMHETEERLNELARLKRKYGSSEKEILAQLARFEERREALLRFDENKEAVLKELDLERKQLIAAAKELHQLRKKEAVRFETAIERALTDLNFLKVQFKAEINEGKRYTAAGSDEVCFKISTNPGEELKPLSRVASGGELSRIMLAIKSMIADSDRIGTLVFDEIDSGVSGRTAAAVAEKLSEIAGNHQVICISHLPQIVSAADTHYLIEKSADDGSTVTSVRCLNEEESIREIARLLSAGELTDTGLRNAEELKRKAGTGKERKPA